jgi:UDP-4-amino-4,6-dideoxy-N-acetyl-beta-L-altrosamine N-acetyltransferase
MITLRDLQAEDKAMLLTWRNLPDVARYMYTDHHITDPEHERWFSGVFGDPTRRYWIIRAEGEDVGLVNLYSISDQNKRCHWAFYVANPNARGKGVGTAVEYIVMKHVFEERGFNKLCCEVLASNEPVVRHHLRCGFREEGRFRQHVIKDGQAIDVVALAILVAEWQGIRREIEARVQKMLGHGGSESI